MAVGDVTSRVATDTLSGASEDSTALTPTAGFRISAVFTKYTAPEVALTGIASDATGDAVTVYWKVLGKAGETYPVTLTVTEIDDTA